MMVLGMFFMGGCASSTDGGGEEAVKDVPAYTIEQFIKTERVTGAPFSHDESKVLVSSNVSGIFNVYSIVIADGKRTQLTFSEDASRFGIAYFPKDDRFLFRSDNNGDELFHIYMMDLEGKETDLTPHEGVRAQFFGWSRDRTSFYYGMNKRDPQIMDVYEMQLEDFSSEMVYENTDNLSFGGISPDKKYVVLVKAINTNDSYMYLYNRETKERKDLVDASVKAAHTPTDFSADSKTLYYLTDDGGEFKRLMSYNMETGEKKEELKADWDVMYASYSYNDRYRVVGINEDARTIIKVTDLGSGADVALPEIDEGEITAVRVSRSEKKLAFYAGSSKSPYNLYVYNFETKENKKLTNTLNPEIDINYLVEGSVVRYKSVGDVDIPAILYKPLQASKDAKVPGLVWVHGGPGGQSKLSYFPLIQYLINHGYAVLAVNNRGSSGYGKTFFKMDDRRHGEEDLQDCIKGKEYLQTLDYVDGDKIGIIGGSYGGFMTMAALTRTPEEFDVGVNIFGVTNWLRTLQNMPPWWGSYRDAMFEELGDPAVDSVRLYDISPVFHADKITKPFMVLQGAQDPRVLKVESDEIVAEARKNGVFVDYVLFEDEGHGFIKQENQIKGYGKILTFLNTYLRDMDKEEETAAVE